MNGFRLMLCVLGLVAYAVTKQFTAPDSELSGLVPPGHLIGLTLGLPQPPRNDAALLWMNASSNAEPSLTLRPSSHSPLEPEPISLNAAARNKARNPVHHSGFNGSMRLEPN